jgi:phosphatidylserine decarboxylase
MGKIQIFNRYTRKLEIEPICGEWFVRLAYGNFLGRLLQRLIFSRPLLSRIAGWYANRTRSAKRIQPFINRYGIPVEESQLDVSQFATFNEFFFRTLKPEARPIAKDRDNLIAPADGRYFYIPVLNQWTQIAVKGRRISLKKLIANVELAKKFEGGSALIVRLCPLDYHRFHFPCDSVPGKAQLIRGKLLSVHPLALRHCNVFPTNKRMLTRMVTSHGEVLMMEIGATFVGSICQTYTPHRYAKKGSEKGFFSFGGSTIILIFESNSLRVSCDIREMSQKNLETYVRMGDRIGNFLPAKMIASAR